ncbi:DUF2334 domain-containing protein [Saccharopolyspora rhizosphaerae]|uniref:DUF2334 domain-containing protein n=1 Tax=Saccharopolyspora rhizosphaerae TaxID=2492662 RepID=A0A3R8NTY9_9PSEU|nr:DUF2334 domain-containing protein [Saccharopolyspora rhizosphaerae]RRO13194.1 DUF2334 domain-containing protein [Saccharopolyspora rhizosphaerae]
MSTPLVVSLSGLQPRSLDSCAEFAAELDRRGVPLSLLVPPRPDDLEAGLRRAPLLGWVAERVDRGDAVSLHGFARTSPGLRSRLAPAARLPAHEAGLRLVAASAVLEQAGLRTRTFVPPRWVASTGTVLAAQRRGFEVCADAMGVRDLGTGRVLRSRIRFLGPGEVAEPWWCRALVLGAGRAARRGRAVRLAVDARALAKPAVRHAVVDAVDLALHHGADPVTYASFATTCPPEQRIPTPRIPPEAW